MLPNVKLYKFLATKHPLKEVFNCIKDKDFFVYYGGRMGLKSTFLADLQILWTFYEHMNGKNILSLRETMTSLTESSYSMVMRRIKDWGLSPYFTSKDKSITNTVTGVKILFRGISSSSRTDEGLKSFDDVYAVFVDEAQPLTEKSLRLLIPTVVRYKGAKLFFAFNQMTEEDPIWQEFLVKRKNDDNVYIKATTYKDNIFLLNNETALREINRAREHNEQLYRHVYLTDMITDVTNGLIKRSAINYIDNYVYNENDYKSVHVAIDPTVAIKKEKEHTDEAGIIVLGITNNDDIHIIEDLSGIYNPDDWAKIAVDTYNKYNASSLFAESNNGGHLVIDKLQSIDGNVLVHGVWSRNKKHHRVEKISSEFTVNKRVYFCQPFRELTTQLCSVTINGITANRDDRLDALVIGIHEIVKLEGITIV